MPHRREHVARRGWHVREASHDVLPSFLIAVHEVDSEAPRLLDQLKQRSSHRVVTVADRALPKALVTRGNEEVPAEAPKLAGVGIRERQFERRHHMPRVEYREASTDVAHAGREIEDPVLLLEDPAPALHLRDVIVGPR